MPTASGRPTADEKRETDRIAQREARLIATAQVTTPEWVKAEADKFEAALAALEAGKADGTIKSYEEAKQDYPAGVDIKVGRRTISEGVAKSYAVSDELRSRGVQHSCYMTFGIAQGPSSVYHGIRSY